MKRKYTDDQELKIVEMYKLGDSTVNIGKLFDASASTIASIVKRHLGVLRSNKENSIKYNYDTTYFEEINTPEKAYWLGFIYADGYINKSISFGITLSIADINHLAKFKEDIKAEHPIKVYKASKPSYSTNDYCKITICGDKIYNNMIKHGVIPNKTLVLKPPFIDKKLVPHFIRGYIDGDGCITEYEKKKQYAVKIVGTEDFLDFIKDYIHNNKVAVIKHYYKRRQTDKVMSLELTGNFQVKKFLDLIYKDSTVHLERKKEKYIKLCELLHSRAQ